MFELLDYPMLFLHHDRYYGCIVDHLFILESRFSGELSRKLHIQTSDMKRMLRVQKEEKQS
jgi:hypothetical protein